jgi:flagellar biogenesis protein FliO
VIRRTVAILLLVSATTMAHAASTAPSSKPELALPSYGDALMRMLLALAGIVAALLIAARLLPRLMRGRLPKPTGQDVQLLDTIALDARHRLHVVRFGSTKLLIGATGDRLVTLASDSPSHAGSPRAPDDFARFLGESGGKP